MNIYSKDNLADLLSANTYPGRGIVVGMSGNARYAVCAYFIMGRSENSRNRIFVEKENALYTHPFDAAKVTDPSLIIYAPVRRYENHLIVTNGDQTDTIYDGLTQGKSFACALQSRCFEPDRPNFTPRISAMLTFADAKFTYQMSILKSADAEGTACNRYTFSYEPLAGLGHFLHTYRCDGNPIPTFTGEPERVTIPDDIDTFANMIWDNLHEQNKISLYVCYVDLSNGTEEKRIFNKNQ